MKYSKAIFSPVFMAIIMVVLGLALAIATLLESRYGTLAAHKMIYDSRWVELLWFLLAVNLTGQIVIHRLYRPGKISIMLFHAAFIIIIAGGAVTRYTGFEGTMHIREGQETDQVNGSMTRILPFSIRLDDFIIERYPGSNSPSGFKSTVTVIDDKGFSYDIYMNHILKYRGYRFFQSSYDDDEMGTVLTVSHDPAGIAITYTGYGILLLFIIISLFRKNSLFRSIKAGYWSTGLKKTFISILLFIVVPLCSDIMAQSFIPGREAADLFETVLVQDQNGRTEPLGTLSSDILRKISREKSMYRLSPTQIVMGYSLDFKNWQNVPLIKVSDRQLQELLGLKSDYASFSDLVFLGETNAYKLAPYIKKAYSKPPSARNRFDKEVIKTDERVNICYMLGHGDFLRIFPVDSSAYWHTPADAVLMASTTKDSAYITSVLTEWIELSSSDGYSGAKAQQLAGRLIQWQREHSIYDLPSPFKVRCEIIYNKAGLFEKLFPFYIISGILLLIVLIAVIMRPQTPAYMSSRALRAVILVAFILHTMGLALRWYISGHSPMSNGYESMLFISWVLLVAGFYFVRRSLMPLAATTILAGMTLMVAHLSFMDPEITNLVPVLKSYWLTLHVSVITGSYAFLGLSALLGMINLIMLIMITDRNSERITGVTDQLTIINYQSLTLGLYMLTIGTFLGAVWANESWGRYWGWDPKETWSLITIIVYTLVTHSRLIPALRNIYAFNLLALAAFSSVLMTYFGVNYFLGGMHSYAAGESNEISGFIYLALALLILLAISSGIKYNRSVGKGIISR